MKIESVCLKNYACFQEITVLFKSRFSVIVGINGSGKTSLLNAIRGFLSYHFTTTSYMPIIGSGHELNNVRIIIQSYNGLYRYAPQLPAEVAVEIVLPDSDAIAKTSLACDDQSLSCVIKDFSKAPLHEYIRNLDKHDTLPLFAYFSAERNVQSGNGNNYSVIDIAQNKTSRLDAYSNCISTSSTIADLKRWIIAKTLERLQTIAANPNLPQDEEAIGDELSLVNSAISLALSDVVGLRFDLKQNDLMMMRKRVGSEPECCSLFDTLSEGERVISMLVADIARRMCILNPALGKEVLKQTQGIVLIDEIDSHLHPQWQRHIPIALKTAFPKIQFIVTTHSPQVLSELKPEEIILLSGDEARNPEVSYGLDANAILEVLMNAAPRPQQVIDAIRDLFESIARGELDKSKDYLRNLRAVAPGIPEIDSADALIFRKETIGK